MARHGGLRRSQRGVVVDLNKSGRQPTHAADVPVPVRRHHYRAGPLIVGRTREGEDLHLATTGDLNLATGGDFLRTRTSPAAANAATRTESPAEASCSRRAAREPGRRQGS